VKVRSRDAEAITDGHGRFMIAVPPGAHLSVAHQDMLGGAEVGRAAEQVVEIRLMQMPE
jgi:hypothetical protein